MTVTPEQRNRVQTGIAVFVLAGAWIQHGIGGGVTATGERVGIAAPVATLCLLIGVAAAAALHRKLRLPCPSRLVLITFGLACLGILGICPKYLPVTVRELVQLAEILLVAPWLFQRLLDLRWRRLETILGLLCLILLALGVNRETGTGPLDMSATKYAVFIIIGFPFLLALMMRLPQTYAVPLLALSGTAVGVTFASGGALLTWLLVGAISCCRFRPARLFIPGLLAVLIGIFCSMLPTLNPSQPWQTLDPQYDSTHLKRFYVELKAAARAPRYFPLGAGFGQYREAVNQLRLYGPHVPHAQDEKVPRDGNSQYLVTLVENGLPAAIAMVLLLPLTILFLGRASWRSRGQPASPGDDDCSPVPLGAAILGAWMAGFFCLTLSRGLGIWVGIMLGMAARHCCPDLDPRHCWRRLFVPAYCAGTGLLLMFLLNNGVDQLNHLSDANRYLRYVCFDDVPPPGELQVVTLPDDFVNPQGENPLRTEAEAYQAIEEPFRVIQDNEASAYAAIAAPNETAKGKGHVTYRLRVPATGDYRLYARVFWEDGCSNSLAMESEAGMVVLSSDIFSRWHTLRAARALSLEEGEQTIIIRNLEDGVRIDYWGLQPE